MFMLWCDVYNMVERLCVVLIWLLMSCSPPRSSEVWRVGSVAVEKDRLVLNLKWGDDSARVTLCGVSVREGDVGKVRSHLDQLLANAPRQEVVVFQAEGKSEVFIPQRGRDDELFLGHELVEAGLGQPVDEGCPN